MKLEGKTWLLPEKVYTSNFQSWPDHIFCDKWLLGYYIYLHIAGLSIILLGLFYEHKLHLTNLLSVGLLYMQYASTSSFSVLSYGNNINQKVIHKTQLGVPQNYSESPIIVSFKLLSIY